LALGEIWISEKTAAREGIFFIANALARMKAKADGAEEESASTSGLNVERFLRERLNSIKYRAGRAHKRVPMKIYREQYTTLPDERFTVKLWIVDGNLVRSFYSTEYTEGGHGYVYPWVPKDEIWVEEAVDRRERPFIVIHEYLEHRLMRDRKLDYETAHAICSKVEFHCRKDEGLKRVLVSGRRRIHKGDLPNLTAPEFFAHVVSKSVRGLSHPGVRRVCIRAALQRGTPTAPRALSAAVRRRPSLLPAG
jgi:hypothetical protein